MKGVRRIERFRGSLFGLAVGDALGTALEFKEPGSFSPVHEMLGGGSFALEPGMWTDDTSMALCLAESLIISRGFDPQDQMRRYLRWYREGHLSSTGFCFDIGNTVKIALQKFEQTGEPNSGPTGPRTAGNGSIMRLAPVPMFYFNNPREAVHKAADSSRTTHGAKNAVDACRYFGAVVVGALNGLPKEEILSENFEPAPGVWSEDPLALEIVEIAAGSFKRRNPPDIKGTGYVVNSLEAALWAFFNSSSFREGALLAVNLGDDADTTAAVFGQLAGAYYGEKAIPEEWLSKLAKSALIGDYAEKIHALALLSQ